MEHDRLERFLRTRARQDFDALMKRERAAMLNAALRTARERSLAEDAVQEVFVKLLESPPDPRDVHFGSGWLIARVISAARALSRSEGRRRRREELASAHDAHVRIDAAEHEEIRDALDDLPEPQRECVELRYLGGLSAEEIARALGCARRTVDERLSAARDRLRRKLAPHTWSIFVADLAREGAPPAAEITGELEHRLDRLLDHPSLARHGTFLSTGAIAAFVAAGAIAITVAATWSSKPARPRDFAAAPLASSERGGIASANETSAPDPSARSVVANELDRSVAARVLHGTALRIEVVGPDGARVRDGQLRLEAASFEASARILSFLDRPDLERYGFLLEPIALAQHNPLELESLPRDFEGIELRAFALVPGFGAAVPADFVIEADRLSEVRLSMEPARSIHVVVEDARTHAPIANASVVSTTEAERRDLRPNDAGTVAVTDATGACTLDGLGAGAHEIEVNAAGYASAEITVPPERAHVAIALVPIGGAASIAVTVRDGRFEPLPAVHVIARLTGRALERRLETDARGVCVLDGLEPGNWNVTLDLEEFPRLCARNRWSGANQRVFASIDVAGADRKELELGFLRGGCAWSIQVLDGENRPAAGHEVAIVGPVQRTATSSETGWVRFDDLPPGAWTARAHEWVLVKRDLARGASETDSIRLGSARIVGRVVDANGAPVPRAWVVVQGPQSTMATCDADGRFELRFVATGTYVLAAASPEGASADVSVRVDGEAERIDGVRLQLRRERP